MFEVIFSLLEEVISKTENSCCIEVLKGLKKRLREERNRYISEVCATNQEEPLSEMAKDFGVSKQRLQQIYSKRGVSRDKGILKRNLIFMYLVKIRGYSMAHIARHTGRYFSHKMQKQMRDPEFVTSLPALIHPFMDEIKEIEKQLPSTAKCYGREERILGTTKAAVYLRSMGSSYSQIRSIIGKVFNPQYINTYLSRMLPHEIEAWKPYAQKFLDKEKIS